VIATEPLDLARKIDKTKDIKGPKLIIALSPCPTGWDFEPRDLIKIGKLAVSTGIWPLKEYYDGRITHTKIPHPRLPVEAYLTCQGRFRHLFHPHRNEALLNELRTTIDDYWKKVE
jgi:pyruvate ferredoxin oxidoreductase beta subunit